MNNFKFLLLDLFKPIVLGSFANKIFGRKKLSLPKKVGPFTLFDQYEKKGSNQRYKFGIYKDKLGKKYLAKMWQGKFKDFAYLMLKNEEQIGNTLKDIYKKNYKTIPSNLKRFRINNIAKVHSEKGMLVVLFDFIYGTSLSKESDTKKAHIINKAEEFLSYLNSKFSKSDISNSTQRDQSSFIISFPILAIKAIITHPNLVVKILKGLFKFYLFSPSLYKAKNLEFAHRDLHAKNILHSSSNYYIFDFALSTLTLPLYEQIISLSYNWENEIYKKLSIKKINTYLKENNFNPSYAKALGIYISTHMLIDKNMPASKWQRYASFLEYNLKANQSESRIHFEKLPINEIRPVNVFIKLIKVFPSVINELFINKNHKNIELPKFINNYKLIKNLQPAKSYPFAVGLYKNNLGKNVVVKIWQGSTRDIHYYDLLREIITTKVLDGARKRLSKKIPLNLSKIYTNLYTSSLQNSEKLILLTKYIKTDNIIQKNVVKINSDIINYLKFIGSKLNASEEKLITKKTASFYILSYPLVLVASILRHPHLSKTLLKGVLLFVKNFSNLSSTKLSIVHGDLHLNNIIIKDKNLYISDLEQTIITYPEVELITNLLSKQNNFVDYQKHLVNFFLQNPILQKRVILLMVFYSTLCLTGNTTLESENRHQEVLNFAFLLNKQMTSYQLKQKTPDVNPRMNALNNTALAVKLRRNHGREPMELHKLNFDIKK